MNNTISNKTVHILWLGPKPVYDKYMPTLRKFLPKGFTIKIWRDDEIVPLCQDCGYFKKNYELKNWAFCTDYARFKILYTYGGIYLDTDVELLAPIDDLVEKGTFFANEKVCKFVNSGHIMYVAEPGSPIMKRVVDYFINEGHKWEYISDGDILAASLEKDGYVREDVEQHLPGGVTVYRGGTFDGDKENPEPWARAKHYYTHMWTDVRTLPHNQGRNTSNTYIHM